MPLLRHLALRVLPFIGLLTLPFHVLAAEATFFRALNLNGPALEIDGRQADQRQDAKREMAQERHRIGLRLDSKVSLPIQPSCVITHPAVKDPC